MHISQTVIAKESHQLFLVYKIWNEWEKGINPAAKLKCLDSCKETSNGLYFEACLGSVLESIFISLLIAVINAAEMPWTCLRIHASDQRKMRSIAVIDSMRKPSSGALENVPQAIHLLSPFFLSVGFKIIHNKQLYIQPSHFIMVTTNSASVLINTIFILKKKNHKHTLSCLWFNLKWMTTKKNNKKLSLLQCKFTLKIKKIHPGRNVKNTIVYFTSV